MNNKNRAEQLQFLRFFAFFWICLDHLSSWTGNLSDYFPGRGPGYGAVSFFFMLSGFVLSYSNYNRKIELSLEVCKRHFWKRLKKVYPLYFLTTMLAVLTTDVLGLLSQCEFLDFKLELVQLFKNLLLIQSWFKEGFFSFNGVGWFLSTLMFVGLLDIPFVYLGHKIKEKNNNKVLFIIGIVVTFVILSVYSYIFKDNHKKWMLFIIPLGRVWEYIIGVCLGYIVKLVGDKAFASNKIICTVFEVLSFLFLFVLWFQKLEKWITFDLVWVIPNALILLFFGVGGGYLSQLFRMKCLSLLGDITFECYLIHQLIIYCFADRYGYDSLGKLANICFIGMVYLLTILFAFYLNKRGCVNK